MGRPAGRTAQHRRQRPWLCAQLQANSAYSYPPFPIVSSCRGHSSTALALAELSRVTVGAVARTCPIRQVRPNNHITTAGPTHLTPNHAQRTYRSPGLQEQLHLSPPVPPTCNRMFGQPVRSARSEFRLLPQQLPLPTAYRLMLEITGRLRLILLPQAASLPPRRRCGPLAARIY